MSFYIVPKNQVAYIASYMRAIRLNMSILTENGEILNRTIDSNEDAAWAGQLLWDANIKSVEAFYREESKEEYILSREDIRHFSSLPSSMHLGVLKALMTLESQYHGVHKKSPAYQIIQALKTECIIRLPGFKEAEECPKNF